MCRKLEKWDPLMDSLSSKRNQTSKVFIIGHAYWIWEPLRPLISRNARLSTNRSGRNILAPAEYSRAGGIFSHNFLQKNSGWGGGGMYYTCPSLPIAIKYKKEPVGIRARCGSFRGRSVPLNYPGLLNRLSKVNTSGALQGRASVISGEMQAGGNSICLSLTGVLFWPPRRPPWTVSCSDF